MHTCTSCLNWELIKEDWESTYLCFKCFWRFYLYLCPIGPSSSLDSKCPFPAKSFLAQVIWIHDGDRWAVWVSIIQFVEGLKTERPRKSDYGFCAWAETSMVSCLWTLVLLVLTSLDWDQIKPPTFLVLHLADCRSWDFLAFIMHESIPFPQLLNPEYFKPLMMISPSVFCCLPFMILTFLKSPWKSHPEFIWVFLHRFRPNILARMLYRCTSNNLCFPQYWCCKFFPRSSY